MATGQNQGAELYFGQDIAVKNYGLLDIAEGTMSGRGRWRDVTIGAHKVRTMPTLHPAYLLRSPGAKRQAWRDLLAVRAALAAPAGRQ